MPADGLFGNFTTGRLGMVNKRLPRSTTQSSPRWMRGRGMAVVLIPDFGGHFGQSFSGDFNSAKLISGIRLP
jgi:hypothetical protein